MGSKHLLTCCTVQSALQRSEIDVRNLIVTQQRQGIRKRCSLIYRRNIALTGCHLSHLLRSTTAPEAFVTTIEHA
jgi:hypothetical protein